MSQELKCPICGQPTRIYMGNARKDLLCAKHAEALKAGKIEINDKGLFIDKETGKVIVDMFDKDQTHTLLVGGNGGKGGKEFAVSAEVVDK